MVAKELDKFYTDPTIAKMCADYFYKYVDKDAEVVEPSAGAGAFAPYVTEMYDILPEGENIIQADFLSIDTKNKPYYLGNPPFGKNSSLAKKFFNHAAKGCGVIGFILPRTFRKNSVQNSIDLHFHLVEDVLLPEKSFTLEGKPYSVPCVFQVWEYKNEKRAKINLPTSHKDFSFTEKENADFSIRRVGANAGKLNPHNNFSVSSNYFIKANISNVESIFGSAENDLKEAAKNTAGNPSLSKAELVHIYELNKINPEVSKNNS